jgi:UV DNA damage endonuclease
MPRLGLCCIFRQEPIRFRRTTATHLLTLTRRERRAKLGRIVEENVQALQQALKWCRKNGVGAFRINSEILPVATHPKVGYQIEDLPDHRTILEGLHECGHYARRHDVRTSFHPDQFVILASPREAVWKSALADLRHHARMAEWLAADVINIHGGGAYGDKKSNLKRLAKRIRALPDDIRRRLTLENDDRVYTPADLLPVCRSAGVPLVYDIHHQRCLPDGIGIGRTTEAVLATWDREPLFHVSSPLTRNGDRPDRRHHDTVDPADFPVEWHGLEITVDVEAKAKEVAVLQLARQLGVSHPSPPPPG